MKRMTAVIILSLCFSGCASDTNRGLAATQSQIREGVGSSGGGIGVRCGSSVRTLDLYEATEVHQLTLKTVSPGFDDNAIYFGHVFDVYASTDTPRTDSQLLAAMNDFIAQYFIWAAPGSLPPSQDATLPALQAGCSFVQVALYDDVKDKVSVDPTLWGELDSQNKIALIFHEVFYKFARLSRVKLSDDTRLLIGHLFSTIPPDPMIYPLLGKEVLTCISVSFPAKDPDYYLSFTDEVVSGVKGVRAYAHVVDGIGLSPLSNAVAFFPNLSKAEMLSKGVPHLQATLTQVLTNRVWNLEIKRGSETVPNDAVSMGLRIWQGGDTTAPFTNLLCFLNTNHK